MGGWCHIGWMGVWWQVGWKGWLSGWVDGWVFEWMGGWCHMDITYIDQFQKLHIWDPQSVKVYRKAGRVNYLQKFWD